MLLWNEKNEDLKTLPVYQKEDANGTFQRCMFAYAEWIRESFLFSAEAELQKKFEGTRYQIQMLSDKRNTILRVNRAAKTVMDVFRDFL